MKKKLLMILMAMVMTLAFAACGNDEQKDDVGDEDSLEAMEEETTTSAAAEAQDGMQTIELENVQMQIPAEWVLDEKGSSDTEHVYSTADGTTVFSIEAIQSGEDLDGEGLGTATEEYLSELGYEDIGYYDTTVGGTIEGKIIPVDKETNPSGMNQQIITIGKDMIFTVISCQVSGDDFSAFNSALETVKFK